LFGEGEMSKLDKLKVIGIMAITATLIFSFFKLVEKTVGLEVSIALNIFILVLIATLWIFLGD
jgi:hypothetical protein